MIRRPPRSTQSRSSAASDVYKRQRCVPPRRSRSSRPTGRWPRASSGSGPTWSRCSRRRTRPRASPPSTSAATRCGGTGDRVPGSQGDAMTEEIHQGKVAVITGGGRGFGKAFGTALAARGAHVVLADVDGAAAEAAAAEIAGKGGSASGAACDVADEAVVAAVIGEVAEQHGGIDILVNNAGLHSAEGLLYAA